MNYLAQPSSSGDDDFWGAPSGRYWKWDSLGKTLTATVQDRTTSTFPQQPDKVHPTLIVEAEDGVWTLTVSQKHLQMLMRSAGVKIGTTFRATYVSDERTDKGVAKRFTLDILSDGNSKAA